MKHLLNNLETRADLKKQLEAALQLKNTQEQCKEDIKEIATEVKDKYDMRPSEFNYLLQAMFDQEKFMETYEKVTTTSDALDLLG